MTRAEFLELAAYDEVYGLLEHREPMPVQPIEDPVAKAQQHFRSVAAQRGKREHTVGGLNRRA